QPLAGRPRLHEARQLLLQRVPDRQVGDAPTELVEALAIAGVGEPEQGRTMDLVLAELMVQRAREPFCGVWSNQVRYLPVQRDSLNPPRHDMSRRVRRSGDDNRTATHAWPLRLRRCRISGTFDMSLVRRSDSTTIASYRDGTTCQPRPTNILCHASCQAPRP